MPPRPFSNALSASQIREPKLKAKAKENKEGKEKKEPKKEESGAGRWPHLLAIEAVEAERGVPAAHCQLLRRLFLPGWAPRERPHGRAALNRYDLRASTTIAYGDDAAV